MAQSSTHPASELQSQFDDLSEILRKNGDLISGHLAQLANQMTKVTAALAATPQKPDIARVGLCPKDTLVSSGPEHDRAEHQSLSRPCLGHTARSRHCADTRSIHIRKRCRSCRKRPCPDRLNMGWALKKRVWSSACGLHFFEPEIMFHNSPRSKLQPQDRDYARWILPT